MGVARRKVRRLKVVGVQLTLLTAASKWRTSVAAYISEMFVCLRVCRRLLSPLLWNVKKATLPHNEWELSLQLVG